MKKLLGCPGGEQNSGSDSRPEFQAFPPCRAPVASPMLARLERVAEKPSACSNSKRQEPRRRQLRKFKPVASQAKSPDRDVAGLFHGELQGSFSQTLIFFPVSFLAKLCLSPQQTRRRPRRQHPQKHHLAPTTTTKLPCAAASNSSEPSSSSPKAFRSAGPKTLPSGTYPKQRTPPPPFPPLRPQS